MPKLSNQFSHPSRQALEAYVVPEQGCVPSLSLSDCLLRSRSVKSDDVMGDEEIVRGIRRSIQVRFTSVHLNCI